MGRSTKNINLLHADVTLPLVHTECVAVQRSTKNGKFSIICFCFCLLCEHTPWQQLFPFFVLHHTDVTLCFTRSVWTRGEEKMRSDEGAICHLLAHFGSQNGANLR